MSYCVNCGVELADNIGKCPLCAVEVINPAKPDPGPPNRGYPDMPVSGMKTGFRDLVLPISLLMLIPALITLICDYLATGGLSWSIFVVASILLLAVFLLPPLAARKPRAMLMLAADWAATGLYLYVLDRFTAGTWFWGVGLPMTVLAGAIAFIIAALFLYFDLEKLVKSALALFGVGVLSVLIDLFLKQELEGRARIGWSMIVLAPCVVLGVTALVVNGNKRLKEQIKQRFFL